MASWSLNLEVQKDEILSLMNIYCGEDECKLKMPPSLAELERLCETSVETGNDAHPISLTVKLVVPVGDGDAMSQPVKVFTTFDLPRAYPGEVPVIQLSSADLQTGSLVELQQKAIAFAEVLRPDPSMFSILSWLHDRVAELLANDPLIQERREERIQDNTPVYLSRPYFTTANSRASKLSPHECSPIAVVHSKVEPQKVCSHGSMAGFTVCIARIDHMRKEHKYLKVLNSWARELTIGGRILNCGQSHIYTVLVGRNPSNMGEFMRRWRTQSVDVDARGRPCKEKLLNILCHLQQHLPEALPQWLR